MLCMDRDILAEDLSLKEFVSFSFSTACAELKSVMRSPEAGIADCRLRRVREAGSNGQESNYNWQVTRSCAHCSLLIFSHMFWTIFWCYLAGLLGQCGLLDLSNIIHIT